MIPLYSALVHTLSRLRPPAAAVPLLAATLLWAMPGTAESLKLVIEGGSDRLKTNVRHHLDLEQLSCDVDGVYLETAIAGADQAVANALRALGHYQGAWDFSHEHKSGCWRVTLALTPGPRVTLTEVSVTISGAAEDDPDLKNLVASLPLKEGAGLNHGDYEEAKRTIQQRTSSLGYFEGRYTESRLLIDTATNTARARLHFESGPRYRFGEIRYPEPLPLEEAFLQGYQPFREGDPYSATKLITFQNNLISSQYFDNVSVNQVEPDRDTKTVAVDLDLTVKSTYLSTFGAGVSTDIGPRVSYELRNRHFNDEGDTYRLAGQWSPVKQNAGVQYEQPGDDPVREKTLWSLGWQKEDTDSSKSTGYLAEVSRITHLDNGWVLTRSLSLLNETYEIADESEVSTLLYPGIRLTRSRANDPRYPTRGWRLSGGIKGGIEKLVSDTTFTQATADAKVILPFLGGRVIGRTGLGATWVDDFSALPASLRFFAGGDNSVRGFEYESLAPENDQGEAVGGKNLITASIEYDHLIRGNYGAAIFYDTGTAFDTHDFTLYEAAGVGLRWLSPIGPIRVDLAFPLKEGGVRLHLSMGPDL